MAFSSSVFLFFFLPFALASYAACPRAYRHGLLAALSLAFYAAGDPRGIAALCGSIAFNYAAGLLIAARPRSRSAFAGGILGNLGLIAILKYGDFAMRTLGSVFPGVPAWPHLHVPLGVSFFTFHAVSYLADVRARRAPAQRDPVRFTLYMALFPQVILGPILRYAPFSEQLREPPRVTLEAIDDGLRRFIAGLAKKVVLADSLAWAADAAFGADPASLSAGAAWTGLVAYALQIYLDFSAYSDMAVGLGLMFGFRLPENFRWPYLASSVTDFWNRWHLTLTDWFRHYVYFPLGGSRKGAWRTSANIVLVFVLSGLWHGAAWHFVAWGLYYGLLLAAEKALGRLTAWRPPAWLTVAPTLLLVLLGWVIFRSPTLAHASLYFRALGGYGGGDFGGLPMPAALRVIALCAVAATPLLARADGALRRAVERRPAVSWLRDAAYLCVLILCVARIASFSYRPFLYFRF